MLYFHLISSFVVTVYICLFYILYNLIVFLLLQYKYEKRFIFLNILVPLMILLNSVFYITKDFCIHNLFRLFTLINQVDFYLLLQIRYEIKIISFFFIVLNLIIIFIIFSLIPFVFICISLINKEFLNLFIYYKKLFFYLIFLLLTFFIYDILFLFLIFSLFFFIIEFSYFICCYNLRIAYSLKSK